MKINSIAIGNEAGINLTSGDCNIILGDYADVEKGDDNYILVISSLRFKMKPKQFRQLSKALLDIVKHSND